MASDVILKISKLSKSFGAVKALREVDFELCRGEIHGIAGENGAGKSTLMNVIDGIHQPDEGTIRLDGRPVRISSPAVAQQLGIGFVHQEIALCPDVSVAENIFMSTTSTSRAFVMDYKALHRRAREGFAEISDIDPGVLVRDLPISHQQIVEIAKALTLDCRILILDEPTAALTERETRILFGIMRQLAAQGISIIYISHRLAEIFENCDRVSVFRDGRHIMTRNVRDITPGDVVSAMVGRVIENLYPAKQSADDVSEEVVLEVRNLSHARRFQDVSFKLLRGEILGIAGLIGAGRSEIARGICRLEGDVAGEVWLILYFMGHPISIVEALVLETLAQTVRAAAFVMPGAFGVQEAGFMIFGALVGVPTDLALAVSLAKRVRELAVGLPALLFWQVSEGRFGLRRGVDR